MNLAETEALIREMTTLVRVPTYSLLATLLPTLADSTSLFLFHRRRGFLISAGTLLSPLPTL